MARAIDVANYTVTYCNNAGKPISNLKLQKMLYFMWIDYFKESGKELFDDEMCAWQFGPVVPEVYYAFCAFAGLPISINPVYDLDENCVTVLDKLINRYIDVPTSNLVNKSHVDGGAWKTVYKNGEGNRSPIPFDLIKKTECGVVGA